MAVLFSLKDLTLVGFHDFFHEETTGQARCVFFSLHTPKMEPLYVSETVTTTSSLSFGKVTLPRLPLQQYHVVVRLWQKLDSWTLHFEAVVDLRRLALLRRPSRELDDEDLKENSIIWCFDEREYTLPENINNKSIMEAHRRASLTRGRNVPKMSYNVDDIRLLTSLDTGVKELTLLNMKLLNQIDSVLDSVKGKVSEHDPEESRALKFRIHTLHRYITKQRNNNDTLSSKVYERKVLIGNLQRALEDHFPPFKDLCEGQLEYVTSQIDPIHELLGAAVNPEIVLSLRAMGDIISRCFLIESVGEERFSILGIDFPSSTKELLNTCYDTLKAQVPDLPTSVDRINAGLSYIVALMLILADILGVLLNYAMKYLGSRSTVVDHLADSTRKSVKVTYPLFFDARHSEKVVDSNGRRTQLKNIKFEQGLHLLNKNLVTLIDAASNLYSQLFDHKAKRLTLPSEGIDNLLWNLKHLLLFMTAPESAAANSH